ncbi:DUF4430 domain-containing protein [Clostridium sp. MSJ-4]|uniref:DUF4430 domain-containing protein n=1 Tax=Clostridium simiarum TaxID=2841506 RepID=A0ABS6EXJ0_9CLOT|nr:DUF4430 domain-containing protein [Clostridium simiarum]MBU5590435.1 DUF4430 domain-containing protein [Clostridium simiarum]
MKNKLKNSFKHLGCLMALMLLVLQFHMPMVAKALEVNSEINIRVEGPKGTIAEGKEKGNNAYEALTDLLQKNNISFLAEDSQYGKFIKEIDGIKSGDFGGYDGWLYYIKNGTKVESASVGIDSYELKEGDNIVVYYGEFNTPYVNLIQFNPEIVKENESFEMIFSYKNFDFMTNKDVITPIAGGKVLVDNKEYVTDETGKIVIDSLTKGEHQYSISGYEENQLPKVIKDRGKFTIDNVNKPLVYFNDDNSVVKEEDKTPKDIEKELEITLNYIKKNSSNPWAALALNKYGIKADEGFLKPSIEDIKSQGIKEMSPTELETISIALTALGYSPYDFLGHNLVEELYSRNLEDFYNNEVAFALLAYNYLNINDNYKIGEKQLIEALLNSKLSYEVEGKKLTGWTWYGEKIDPDMTAVVISALSPYYRGKEVEGINNKQLKDSLDNAVDSLSLMQNSRGDIIGQYGPASETNSFAIVALTSLGIDPEGNNFTKENGDLVSALLSYKGDNGQYNHDDNTKNNYLSTEEALRALISLDGFKNNGFYDYYKGAVDAKTLPAYKIEESKENNEVDKDNEVKEEDSKAIDNTSKVEIIKESKLPKTGSLFNFSSMMVLAFASIAIGVKRIK